jgi:hypothetical protein
MKRSLLFIIGLAISVGLIFSGCMGENQGNNQPSPSPTPGQATPVPTKSPDAVEPTQTPESTEKPNEEVSSELKALLPDKEDYEWVYNGFADYGHDLELEEIREEDGKLLYIAEGEVHDMSDGESDRDFSLKVTYELTADEMIQKKSGDMMLDLFDEMTIIQLPLEEGNSWTQTVQGEKGEEIKLESTIEKIEEVEGAKVYTVLYKDKDSPYFERRVIKEGVGVTDFVRLYITDEESFEISYSLFEKASGYDK